MKEEPAGGAPEGAAEAPVKREGGDEEEEGTYGLGEEAMEMDAPGKFACQVVVALGMVWQHSWQGEEAMETDAPGEQRIRGGAAMVGWLVASRGVLEACVGSAHRAGVAAVCIGSARA